MCDLMGARLSKSVMPCLFSGKLDGRPVAQVLDCGAGGLCSASGAASGVLCTRLLFGIPNLY